MRPVEEHLAHCLRAVAPLPPLDLPLLDAADCLLAEDVVSAIDLPSFDNSSMDGYAVHLGDVAGASPASPVVLPVVADVPAGAGDPLRLVGGTTVRIMTGAPMPAGAEAVVPVEWTDGGVAAVSITRIPQLGQYVRRAGGDVEAGETVLRAGTRLTPRHLGLAAAVGRDRLRAHPRPRVVVVSTGSELVPPGRPLGPGKIHDSNSFALAAAAAELGADVRRASIVEDDAAAVREALESEVMRADLVVTTGGVSAGAYDVVKEVLRATGTVRFGPVAMQPGMPQGLGTYGPDATPIVTLPGNPVSAVVSFEVFVHPMIRRLRGEDVLHRPSVAAVAASGWSSPGGKRQFTRARVAAGADGRLVVEPVGGSGSHLVADLAEANCLAVVPEDVTEVKAGDELRCLLLERVRR